VRSPAMLLSDWRSAETTVEATPPLWMQQSADGPAELLLLVQISMALKVRGDFRFERVGVCPRSSSVNAAARGGWRSRRLSGCLPSTSSHTLDLDGREWIHLRRACRAAEPP
jgi:hypothetical protein